LAGKKVSFRTLAWFFCFGALGSLLWGGAAPQAGDSAEARACLGAFERHKEMRAASPFKNLTWQFIGPVNMVGRMTDVAADPSRPGLIYVSSAQGGVFKSTDDGETWVPVFEDYPTSSIGDIALEPGNPDVLWVGTGEANILRSSMAGTGLYKSTDGGKTFAYKGLADTQHIARILVHPKNPDIVYVASPGHEYTFSRDRGVYKTTDGGTTWRKVFFKDEKTGVIDLAMDPGNPDILYAGTAERLRYRWNDPKESPQSGLYKTTDGGETWTLLSGAAVGLPDFAAGECERVGLDICLTKPNVVYAVINKKGAYLYRSNDRGASWKLVEGNDKIVKTFPGYGWVFGQVRVDPLNPDVVYVMGLTAWRTRDGGKTWEELKATHVDFHGMWIDPSDTSHLLVVNDGGVMISHDGFATHKHPTNIPIAHMYNAAVSQTPGKFRVYTNVQDTGAWSGEVDLTAGRDKAAWKPWVDAPGDESGRQAVDPTDPNIVHYVVRYGGGPYVMDMRTYDPKARRRRDAKPPVDFGETKKRAQWVSPIIVSPCDPKRVLYGAQFVFVTDDAGGTWRRISPDLTNYEPARQGNIAYSTIFALAESPLRKGVIYAGTDDGNVQVTRDEGATWTKVNDGLPAGRFISSLEASRFGEGTVYVTVNGKRSDDFATYLYKSSDYGTSWQLLSACVPGGSANVVKEDPANGSILYLGTDTGVYVTTDGGATWNVLGAGLPTVYVHDIAIQTAENVAVIATHGRGAYLMDLLKVRAIAGDPK